MNYKQEFECRYERLVECHNRDACLHCGWNPYESYERRKKLRKEFEKDEQEELCG